jgi:uncharacterized protein (DUF305 family)
MPVTTEPGAADTAAPVNGSAPRRDFTFGVGWLAALLIVGLLLGAGGTLLAGRMFGAPGDTSPEAGFLRDMSTHHAQAVEMSMIAHANSTDPQIISLSADIALTQHGQIATMQMTQLRNATGKALDIQFLTLMRAHHLGGIHMAQGILEQSDNKDVTWLAETMVSGQQGELNLIDDMLKKLQAGT